MLPVAVIVVLGGVPGLADHDVAIVIKKESCLLLNSQNVLSYLICMWSIPTVMTAEGIHLSGPKPIVMSGIAPLFKVYLTD